MPAAIFDEPFWSAVSKFQRGGSGTGGRGQLVFRATEVARTMIIAIVTSREAEPGKSKWLTNNDLAKSSSCRFSQAIRNMAIKKQKIHGILLIYCPKKTIYIKKQTFRGTKTRRF